MFVGVNTETGGIILIAAIVAIAVAWYVVAHVFGNTRLGRRANHFLDVGAAELPPEEEVKQRHSGAGGFG